MSLPQSSYAQQVSIGGGIIPGGRFPIGIGGWGTIIGGGQPGNTPKPDPGLNPSPFSLQQPVEAWADLDFGQVVVDFMQELGTVTIVISDAMGVVWSSCTCDTQTQAEVWLPLPSAPGHYILTIANETEGAQGEFDL